MNDGITDIGEMHGPETGTPILLVSPPRHRPDHPHRPPVATDEPAGLLLFILGALLVIAGIHAPRFLRKDPT